MTRSGSPYLALELRDRTGVLPARAFQNADALAGRFERGDVVAVTGRVERFRDELVLEVSEIARVRDRRRGRSGSLSALRLPRPRRARRLSRAPRGRGLRPRLPRPAGTLLADEPLRAQWRRAPCSRSGHHAYLGGLLEHTVAVATLAQETCQLHPRLNSDLLLTAAITHDLGRTREFTYGAELGLTDEGRLLGHLAIGHRMLADRSAALDEQRRLALLHCVLCHHGPASAPGGRFASAEALALYRLNALDASVKGVLEHGLSADNPRPAGA